MQVYGSYPRTVQLEQLGSVPRDMHFALKKGQGPYSTKILMALVRYMT
jgi:hypothetical protein